MKPMHIAAIAAGVAALVSLAIVPQVAGSEEDKKLPEPAIVAHVDAPGPTLGQEEWLAKLVQCESRGDPKAVNPMDRDGTPSYGILQFKPSTFEYYSKLYGVAGELMDPEAQRAIVRRMIADPAVDWYQQFPDCVRNHVGLPPKRGV